jgi:type VI secretion system secreted protein Hcp
VLDFGYKVSQSALFFTGGGGGVGKADFSPLTFSHTVDRPSPILFKYCAAGKHIPSIELSACKFGDGSQEYLNIKLSDAIIVDVNPNASSGWQTVESASIAYTEIEAKVRGSKAPMVR